MKRLIVIILIAISLAGALIYEQIFINNSISTLKEKTNNVYELVHSSTILNDDEIINKINDLNDFWSTRESQLCIIINHKDMEKVGEQITKLLTSCKENNIEQSLIEVDLLKYYTEGYEHIIKLTFQNIW